MIAPSFGTYKVKFTKGDLEATVTLESHSKTFAGTVVTLRKKEGSIYATSTPSGANVHLDGTYKGTSPITIPNVPVGTHTVKYTKTEYKDCMKTVTVYANQQRNVHCDLEEEKFYIRPACQDVNGNHLDGVSYEFVDYPAYKGTCNYNEYLIAPGFGTYKVKFTKGDLEATVTLESHLKTFAGTVVTLREKEKKSDLIIQDISWTPQNPKQGDNVKFAVTIKNIGKGTAGKSHVFIVGINWGANKELFRIEDSCPSLKSGEAHTYYKNAKMENCGKYQLMALADAGGEVNESNENNNYRDASFEIPCEKPDLIIQDVSWTPQNPKLGDEVKFAVTVKNIGKGIAGESHVFVYDMNWDAGKVLLNKVKECPSLKPGEAYTYHKNVKIDDCGEHDLMAWADARNEVNESNEKNNYKDASFEIPCPDLTIQSITWKPENPKLEDNIEFTITVKNQGKGNAGEFYVDVQINTPKLGGQFERILKREISSLAAGKEYTFTVTYKPLDCGKYVLSVVADPDSRVEEPPKLKLNNWDIKRFTVPCPKEEGTLVVNVYSIDGKPAAEGKGTTTIELIKSGDVSPTAKQNIDDKSRVTFTDIPAGNYYINVYHNPQLEQGSKEFWGKRKDISITAGTTTTIDFYRYNPYVDKFYAEKNSVEVNTPVKINVGIKVPSNCPDAKAYVKALVIIRDENGHEVYRKESDDREVQKGDSTTFSFSYTPAKEGTYSGLAKAYIVGGGDLCTDNCGWAKVFEVKKELPPSPRVKVITSDWKYPIDWIETGSKKTIKWLALDDKGVVSIDIYWIDQDMPNTPILIVKGTKNNGEYLWDTTSMEGFYKIMVTTHPLDHKIYY